MKQDLERAGPEGQAVSGIGQTRQTITRVLRCVKCDLKCPKEPTKGATLQRLHVDSTPRY